MVGMGAGERFALRQLLKVAPARSFHDLRTVDGVTYAGFHEAAVQRGIMADDEEAELAMLDACSEGSTPAELRHLFVSLVCELPCVAIDVFTRDVPDPRGEGAGKAVYQHMMMGFDNPHPERNPAADDVRGRVAHIVQPDSQFNSMLAELQSLFLQRGKTLQEHQLPYPHGMEAAAARGLPAYHALFCSPAAVAKADELLAERLPVLNGGQRNVFWRVWQRVCHNAHTHARGEWAEPGKLQRLAGDNAQAVPAGELNKPGIIFMNAPGGRGKTYVGNALLAASRSHGLVAVASCFTGFASQDYDGGDTLHRTFALPVVEEALAAVDAAKEMMSTMDAESAAAALLRDADLIIIDECPTAGKLILSAVDQLLQRLCGTAAPFAGAPSELTLYLL